jgi:hypothetical protein
VLVTYGDEGVCGGHLSGGLFFCISPRNECGSKTHTTQKAPLAVGHIYLTSPDAHAKMNRTGVVSWHVPVEVVGPRLR